jgi:hypothetical protein
VKGFIGASWIHDLTDDVVKELGVPEIEGALVSDEAGQAAKAGAELLQCSKASNRAGGSPLRPTLDVVFRVCLASFGLHLGSHGPDEDERTVGVEIHVCRHVTSQKAIC